MNHWVDKTKANREEMRAIIGYIQSVDLPYWYIPESAHILDQTTLPRAQRSVAKITGEQWVLVLEAIRG